MYIFIFLLFGGVRQGCSADTQGCGKSKNVSEQSHTLFKKSAMASL